MLRSKSHLCIRNRSFRGNLIYIRIYSGDRCSFNCWARKQFDVVVLWTSNTFGGWPCLCQNSTTQVIDPRSWGVYSIVCCKFSESNLNGNVGFQPESIVSVVFDCLVKMCCWTLSTMFFRYDWPYKPPAAVCQGCESPASVYGSYRVALTWSQMLGKIL